MKLYADRPGARLRQLISDVLAVAWTYFWITLAVRLHDLVRQLAVPGQKLESAGNGLAGNLSSAGDKIDGVPAAGRALAAPLRQAAEAAQGISSAGQQQQAAVEDLALVLAILLVTIPLGLVLLGWLPLRLRWARRAGAAARLRRDAAGQDLLALRALVTQPLHRLHALDPGIAAAWRDGDETAVARLAALELRGLGLRGAPGTH
ncbi:MAG: hypothetical protein HKP61_08835 [Dactylosporangium sp.]|nr:hypothetical protein [Dactylosporangium sp.]NNJ61040.1 hypothetical protein [Dactylosporangium sp.]